jgi:hypothetical protein
MRQATANTMRNRVTGRSADRDHSTLGGEAAQGDRLTLAEQERMSAGDRDSNGVRALRGYSVVDGGDVVGITQRGGALVRIPAWTVIGDNLILGAHPADTVPPKVDVIANVDSLRFYDVPEGVIYLHFAYWDTDAVPDATELDVVATFLNDLRSAGETVFVHCRLALNRSALLTGLMLVDEGYRAKDAIELMRDLRSPLVLENRTFERYLLSVDGTRRADAAAAGLGT